jgi:hypothetical protein
MLAKASGFMPLLSHSPRFDSRITAILAKNVDVCSRAYIYFMQVPPVLHEVRSCISRSSSLFEYPSFPKFDRCSAITKKQVCNLCTLSIPESIIVGCINSQMALTRRQLPHPDVPPHHCFA